MYRYKLGATTKTKFAYEKCMAKKPLKALPHVMSPDELENLPDGVVVWREKYDYDNNSENVKDMRLMPMIMFNGIIANYYDYLYPDELRAADDIQLKFRYWSDKPSINLMTVTPWIKREEWIE